MKVRITAATWVYTMQRLLVMGTPLNLLPACTPEVQVEFTVALVESTTNGRVHIYETCAMLHMGGMIEGYTI
jgi:hypothetical protein